MGSIFKTTRRNQDLDMELKVKLQKPVNKKQEKRKWKGNADDTPSIFFLSWRMEKSLKIGLGDVPPPSSFTYSISKIN